MRTAIDSPFFMRACALNRFRSACPVIWVFDADSLVCYTTVSGSTNPPTTTLCNQSKKQALLM
jgi:hypothetical protein